jgi:hypothetical protein
VRGCWFEPWVCSYYCLRKHYVIDNLFCDGILVAVMLSNVKVSENSSFPSYIILNNQCHSISSFIVPKSIINIANSHIVLFFQITNALFMSQMIYINSKGNHYPILSISFLCASK